MQSRVPGARSGSIPREVIDPDLLGHLAKRWRDGWKEVPRYGPPPGSRSPLAAAGPQAMNTSTDWGCDQGTASLGTMATALRHGCALVEGHAACYRPKQSRDEAVLEFVWFLPISLQNRCFANSFT